MHPIIEEENIIEDDILLIGSAASEIPETGNPPKAPSLNRLPPRREK
jgi:hypothetical protein